MIYPIVGIPVCVRKNPSPYHTHPRMKFPVTRHEMEMQLHKLYAKAGLPGEPILNWPNELTQLHEREPRRYAQVYAPPGPDLFAGHDKPRFELAEQARWLPGKHRRGLLAHEVGHVIAPDGSEDAADQAAYDKLGVKIGYDKRWPGKGLQVARRGNPSELDAFSRPHSFTVRISRSGWTAKARTVSGRDIGVHSGGRTAREAVRSLEAKIGRKLEPWTYVDREAVEKDVEITLPYEMTPRGPSLPTPGWEGAGYQPYYAGDEPPPAGWLGPFARNPRIQPSVWIQNLSSMVGPGSEAGHPPLGDPNAEITGYHPRLKGDAIDQVLQAISQGGEGNRATAEYIAEATNLSLSSVRNAIRYLQTQTGTYPFVVPAGLETIGKRNRKVYEISIHGAQAASWERQAAAQSLGASVEEAPEEEFEEALAQSALRNELGLALSKKEDTVRFYDWNVFQEPGTPYIRVQCLFKPFAPNAQPDVVGDLWMRLGPGDDRNFSGVKDGYAVVTHVRVSPTQRRKFIATHLYEIAAKEAEKRGLRLSSGLNMTPGERSFWVKQFNRGRAAEMLYRNRKGLRLKRYMLPLPPPEGLHNPRGYSLEPTIGPTLRRRR